MEPTQVGWAVRWRDEQTDPESEFFGHVYEWWELFDLDGPHPDTAVGVFVHDEATPQDWPE